MGHLKGIILCGGILNNQYNSTFGKGMISYHRSWTRLPFKMDWYNPTTWVRDSLSFLPLRDHLRDCLRVKPEGDPKGDPKGEKTKTVPSSGGRNIIPFILRVFMNKKLVRHFSDFPSLTGKGFPDLRSLIGKDFLDLPSWTGNDFPNLPSLTDNVTKILPY